MFRLLITLFIAFIVITFLTSIVRKIAKYGAGNNSNGNSGKEKEKGKMIDAKYEEIN